MQDRITREIEHGRFLVGRGPGQIWNWETPAGKLRWARRVKMLGSHLRPGMSALELGCGIGLFTAELAQTGAAITAIDISPDLLEIAKTERSASNVNYEVQNAYAMNYAGSTFDTVVGSSVLHHLELEPALREIHRVLKPSGSIFFTEPNMLNPQIAVQKNVPWIKRKLGDSPDETAFFRWPLRRSLEKNGFREIRIEPFDFLHPALAPRFIGPAQAINRVLEKMPVISEFAGSLYLRASK
jgi:SAM-dependent methyltransferase